MTQTTSEGTVTRRALLGTGAAAAAGLAFPGGADALARHRHRGHRRHGRHHPPAHLRRASYHQLVGERFSVVGSRTRLRLVAVRDLNREQAGSENGFTLIFRAPRGAPLLGEDLPRLHHRRLGTFPLFLSAGVASAAGQPYAAVINRTHG